VGRRRLSGVSGKAEAIPSGITTYLLVELTRKYNGFIVAGLIKRDGDRFYNTAVIVGPEGYVGQHRKAHLALSDRLLPTGVRFQRIIVGPDGAIVEQASRGHCLSVMNLDLP